MGMESLCCLPIAMSRLKFRGLKSPDFDWQRCAPPTQATVMTAVDLGADARNNGTASSAHISR